MAARGVIGEAAIRVRPDTSTFEKETKSSVLGTVGKIAAATGAGVAIWKGFDFAKDAVIGFNSTLEQAHAAFKNLLGSGQAANKMLAELQDFAKTTPFAFEQLIPVSQQLVGALGKSADVTGIMTQLGDAISATGGSADKLNQLTLAYTQLATSGTAHLGDLMQINNAVPGALARMAKASGQSVGQFRESVSKSMVSSGEAVKLFKKVTTDPKFGIAGGMAAQSKTFAGAMSNIGDAAQQMLAQAGKPIFEFTSTAAKQFANFLSILQDTGSLGGSEMDQFFGQFGTGGKLTLTVLRGLVTAFGILRKAISQALSILGEVAGIIDRNRDVVVALVSAYVGYKVAMVGVNTVTAAYATLQKTVNTINLLVTGGTKAYAVALEAQQAATKGAAVQTKVLNIALLANPIGLVVVAVAALAAGLFILYERNATVRKIVQDTWAWIKENIPPIIDLIVGKVRELVGWLQDQWASAVEFAGKVWKQWGDEVMFVIRTVWAVYKAEFALIVAVVQTAIAIIRALWDRFGSTLIALARVAWNTIVGVVKGQLQILKGIVNVVLGILTGDWSRAWNGMKGIVSGVLNTIKSLLGGFVGTVRVLAGRIGGALKDGFTSAVSGIGHAGIGIIRGAVNSMVDAINAGLNLISDHWPDIPGAPGPPFGHNPIPHLARGAAWFPGGMALVGEKGPEVAGLPSGGVASNDALIHTFSVAIRDAFGGLPPGGITIIQNPGEDPQALARRVLDEAARRVM